MEKLVDSFLATYHMVAYHRNWRGSIVSTALRALNMRCLAALDVWSSKSVDTGRGSEDTGRRSDDGSGRGISDADICSAGGPSGFRYMSGSSIGI